MEESQELEYRGIPYSPGIDKLSCDDECVTVNEWPELLVADISRKLQSGLSREEVLEH